MINPEPNDTPEVAAAKRLVRELYVEAEQSRVEFARRILDAQRDLAYVVMLNEAREAKS